VRQRELQVGLRTLVVIDEASSNVVGTGMMLWVAPG
jgi:hypothetical protein